VILIAGSVGIWTVERNAGGPIDGFSDAIWWSLTTITTVGYGDTYPVTPEGRGIAAFLMMSGIAVFGVVSANLAALFLRSPEDSREDELLRRIEQLTAVVEELKTERSSIHA
jgi:voltage-gated potassium channel